MPRAGSTRARWPKASTTARGYGAEHQRERARWAPLVAAGGVPCHRPGHRHLLLPGQPWDLGHHEDGRPGWRGPECRRGNRVAGGRNGAAVVNARRQRARLPVW